MSSTISTAPLSPILIAEPVHEFATISQKVRVGYMPTVKVDHISQLHGSIVWGDGTTSDAGFERNKKGGIDIVGTHAYVKPGTFAISTDGLAETPWVPKGVIPLYIISLGTLHTTATVDATPPTLTEVATQSFTASLGSFTQPVLDIAFTAKIHWGDGHTTIGTVSATSLAKGDFSVLGTHTYARTGLYTVHAEVYSQVVGSKLKPTLSHDFVTLIKVMGKA